MGIMKFISDIKKHGFRVISDKIYFRHLSGYYMYAANITYRNNTHYSKLTLIIDDFLFSSSSELNLLEDIAKKNRVIVNKKYKSPTSYDPDYAMGPTAASTIFS